jgi:hypothetical protein
MATRGQQQRWSKQRKKGRSDGADAPDNPQQPAGETLGETPDDATSGSTGEQTGGDRRPATMMPEASASTHPFSTPEWIDSPVIGGAKSSIQRDENVPSFLEAIPPEEEPEDRDEEIWREAMNTVQNAGPASGFTQEEWNRGVKHLAGGTSGTGGLEGMMEEAKRLELPEGFKESEWKTFLRIAEVDLKKANR